MKKIVRISLLVVLLTTIFTFMDLSRGPNRAYASSCSAAGCDFKDPVQTGCNQTIGTTASITVYDETQPRPHVLATGRNVYSYGCHANWAEGTATVYASGIDVYVHTLTKDSNGNYVSDCFEGGDTTSQTVNNLIDCSTNPYTGPAWPAFGNMVDGTHVVEACVWALSKATSQWFEGCASQ